MHPLTPCPLFVGNSTTRERLRKEMQRTVGCVKRAGVMQSKESFPAEDAHSPCPLPFLAGAKSLPIEWQVAGWGVVQKRMDEGVSQGRAWGGALPLAARMPGLMVVGADVREL
jgi:hypothetical protein